MRQQQSRSLRCGVLCGTAGSPKSSRLLGEPACAGSRSPDVLQGTTSSLHCRALATAVHMQRVMQSKPCCVIPAPSTRPGRRKRRPGTGRAGARLRVQPQRAQELAPLPGQVRQALQRQRQGSTRVLQPQVRAGPGRGADAPARAAQQQQRAQARQRSLQQRVRLRGQRLRCGRRAAQLRLRARLQPLSLARGSKYRSCYCERPCRRCLDAREYRVIHKRPRQTAPLSTHHTPPNTRQLIEPVQVACRHARPALRRLPQGAPARPPGRAAGAAPGPARPPGARARCQTRPPTPARPRPRRPPPRRPRRASGARLARRVRCRRPACRVPRRGLL